MSQPTATDSVPARAKWSRSRKIFAIAGALILVFVGTYVAYGYLNGLPPEEVALLGRGQTYLDVAFMTLYTPSIPGAADFNVSVVASFAHGWNTSFAWGNVSGSSLPVRFVLAPSESFAAGPSNGFVYTLGSGAGSVGVTGPHAPGACVTLWTMNYSVRELSAWSGFTKTSWLEVDYRLTPVVLNIGPPLPVANVTVPTPADLLPTGIADNLNLTVQPGYLVPLYHDIYNASAPMPTFHHTLPAVTFDTGSLGPITAWLTSSFRWSKGDNYRVWMSFSGSLHGYLTWYWDARFGSLYTIYTA